MAMEIRFLLLCFVNIVICGTGRAVSGNRRLKEELLGNIHNVLNNTEINFLVTSRKIPSECFDSLGVEKEQNSLNLGPSVEKQWYYRMACTACTNDCRPEGKNGHLICQSVLVNNVDNSKILYHIHYNSRFKDEVQDEINDICGDHQNCSKFNNERFRNCSKHHKKPPHKDDIWAITESVGLLLSLLCLLFTIFVHVALPEMRNLHGKNISCFSFSMLISQMFMFHDFGIRDQNVCVAIAVILQYFWLVVFAWTSILSFDIARTFNAFNILQPRRQEQHIRRFGIYCLVGWGAPFVLVSIAYVVIEKLYGHRAVYGTNPECFMHYFVAIYALGIPLLLSIFFNFICFGIIIYGIEANRKRSVVTTFHRGKGDRFRCFVYAKLAVICGLAWILFFLFHYFGEGFKHVSALLFDFQSILLFMSTVLFNRRAVGAVKRRMNGRKYTSQSSTEELYTISRP